MSGEFTLFSPRMRRVEVGASFSLRMRRVEGYTSLGPRMRREEWDTSLCPRTRQVVVGASFGFRMVSGGVLLVQS